MSGGIDVTLERAPGPDALEAIWTANQSRLCASFFQSWTWTGCLYEERYTDPVLLRAHDRAGTLVAIALFNRTRRFGLETLHLHESGDPGRDAIYIEDNGLLIAPGAPEDTIRACANAARRAPIGGRPPLMPRRLVLSGLAGDGAGWGGRVIRRQPAPYLDLAAATRDGKPWTAGLRANARQQLARARRAYEREGPVALTSAATAIEAQAALAELIALHEASWTARGRPGAFATAFVRRFHAALATRGVAEGTVSVRRATCGGSPFAVLYDFTDSSGIHAYQSGLDYGDRDGRARQPGLVAHALAINEAGSKRIRSYDFLAGDAQYKRMLSNAERPMTWRRRATLAAPAIGSSQ